MIYKCENVTNPITLYANQNMNKYMKYISKSFNYLCMHASVVWFVFVVYKNTSNVIDGSCLWHYA